MEIEENIGGGTSVLLTRGDDLGDVPESHRDLLTSALREAFVDPPAYFGRIADASPLPAMARWLRALVRSGTWELALHRGDPPEWAEAGFAWWSTEVHSAGIGLPPGEPPASLPEPLRRFHALVDRVSWMPFGAAGGIDGPRGHTPLTNYAYTYYGDPIDPARTFAFGSDPGGDMLIYADDGRAGWLGHESGRVRLPATIDQTLDWAFGELIEDRAPEPDAFPF